MKKIHIIACGGAVMHNFALALKQQGNIVTGSDDEIFEPAYSRLKNAQILPNKMGWFEDKITTEINFIILGMHAKANNPEVIKAKELGIQIYSFPEYFYEHSKNKTRIVVAGSHGKTTTTAMIMHVLKHRNFDFDYLVGSQIKGYDLMVKFSNANLVVIEGDEYLNSALDPVPKFWKYHPHYTQITGIAWDHINVFPTFDKYISVFEEYVKLAENNKGKVVFFEKDEELKKVVENNSTNFKSYNTPNFKIVNGKTIVIYENIEYEMPFFGKHNLQNMEGAKLISKEIGISEADFYESMTHFTGTSKRMEPIFESEKELIFRDFAHSPSKLKATCEAIKSQYTEREFLGIFELHTFSSLNPEFLKEYKDSMIKCDSAWVYFNPKVLEHKKMQALDKQEVINSFGENVEVFDDINELLEKINNLRGNVSKNKRIIAVMSSGNFDNKLTF